MINKRKHKKYIRNKDIYKTAGAARKRARKLGLKGIHSHGRGSEDRPDDCRDVASDRHDDQGERQPLL